jgi:hypothetical protein
MSVAESPFRASKPPPLADRAGRIPRIETRRSAARAASAVMGADARNRLHRSPAPPRDHPVLRIGDQWHPASDTSYVQPILNLAISSADRVASLWS